jgi:glycosyltransferase involved in cell wall biosynthesis
MKIGFLVGDIVNISGGSNVIIEYAARLQTSGHEVVLITGQPVELTPPLWHPRLHELTVRSLSEVAEDRFDFLFATWWVTYFDLWRLEASVYGYLNQSLESRFHGERHYKVLNRLTYGLPLLFVTEARWIEEFIQLHRPDSKVIYVQNGLSRDNFPCVESPPNHSGKKLRVLVEGPWAVDFKGVPETFEVLEEASAELDLEVGWLTSNSNGARPTLRGKRVKVHERIPINSVKDVLQHYDVIIKLSKVEGMFGPPLEMFSQGGTAITYTVTGSDEYMVHGHNGFVVEPHNRRLIIRYLRQLQESPELLATLRRNALETARAFPSWEESTQKLLGELEALHASGYSNAHLRSALATVSALRGQWLSEVWRNEGRTRDGQYIGPGELTLLERYRRIKSSPLVQRATQMVPQDVRQSLRRHLTKALS